MPLSGHDSLTSDTWHPSPEFQALDLQSPVISAPDCGFRGTWKPLPVLPGIQPLKTRPPRCQSLGPKDSRSPLSTGPRIFISHPERRSRCRLFVLTILQVPSPASTGDSEPVRSPPCTSPESRRPSQTPQVWTQGPSPAPTSPARATQHPSAVVPAAHRAWSRRSLPRGLAAALAGPKPPDSGHRPHHEKSEDAGVS